MIVCILITASRSGRFPRAQRAREDTGDRLTRVIHRRLDLHHRQERIDRIIAASGNDRTRAPEFRRREQPLVNAVVDVADRVVHGIGIPPRPLQRHARDDAEARETRNIRGIDRLQVRDRVAQVARPVRVTRGLEIVERLARGAVADRVDMDLPAGLVELDDSLLCI